MNEVTIRNYQSKDYDQIIHNQKISENNMYDAVWDSRANFEDLVTRDPTNVIVAEVDDKIVGSLIIAPLGPDQATLYRLNIEKEFRNRGIATQLLKHADEICRERGIKELGMYVDSENSHLLEYYTARGFTPSTGHIYRYLWKDLTEEGTK